MRPPIELYSPSVFSRTTQKSISPGLRLASGDGTPSNSRTGRRFTYSSNSRRRGISKPHSETGAGKPGFAGDRGSKDGKVVALGRADGPAAATIDAAGKVIAPGFVDVHTHYDAQVLWDRMLSISPWHGVTTTVIGNCGFGFAPTRAVHLKLILPTLGKVEGMRLG